jgi:hypothetical protein
VRWNRRRYVSVHRLVHEVTRERTPQEERRNWIDRTLRLVSEYALGDPIDIRTWPLWNALRPHAAEIVLRADRAGIAEPTNRLMGDLDVLLHYKWLWPEAEPLMRRCIAILCKLGKRRAISIRTCRRRSSTTANSWPRWV